uniref:Uncharacterized protein n=1 Tax=Ganoderma calidophilum TaxID=2026244 RepID=A0A2S1WBK2_9APHY|nr:hypothetical protein [Ganoderma calidophilum]AWJ63980.1 hypothetical protein [Ganoderma calidophilum]
MIKHILSYLSLKSLLLFFSKFSFGRIFTPYFRAFLRVFFSDRKTAFLLRVFGSFFGVFRLLNAMLGPLIFINLYSYKGLSSIPASMLAFLSLLKKEFNEAIDRYFPNHPHFSLPGTFSKTMDNINHTVSDVIHHSPVATDIAYNIAKEVKKVEHFSESKFESLRKLYSQYKPSWDWFPFFKAEETYSLFSDWKFYLGMLFLLGVGYWFFGESIRSGISNGLPSNPFKRDDDHGRPGNFQTPQRASGSNDVDVEAQHLATPGSEYRRTWPSKFYGYLQDRFPWGKPSVARDNPALQHSDLPSAPTHEPTNSKGKFTEAWVNPEGSSSSAIQQISPSVGRRKGASQAQETLETYRRDSLEEERTFGDWSESVNTVANFSIWDYIRPKLIPPRPSHDPNFVDVFEQARVRSTKYDPDMNTFAGRNVYISQDENGFTPDDKNEQALLGLINKDWSKTAPLPFVEPDSDTESDYGDVPPSLTDDNSSIVDDNSSIGDTTDSGLSDVCGTFWD